MQQIAPGQTRRRPAAVVLRRRDLLYQRHPVRVAVLEVRPRRPLIWLAGGESTRTSRSSDAKPRAVPARLGTLASPTTGTCLFTNATAFSPTDASPLVGWAKDGHACTMSSVPGHDRAGSSPTLSACSSNDRHGMVAVSAIRSVAFRRPSDGVDVLAASRQLRVFTVPDRRRLGCLGIGGSLEGWPC